jgi:PHD/YefM family antitoxin component YafN of YafNO toxin-antitoxin module
MHTLSAMEVKRRGVAVLEEAVKHGPVHIIKNNKPTCVVLSEEQYAELLNQQKGTINLWDLLSHRPWKGARSKKEIDQQVRQERNDWDK